MRAVRCLFCLALGVAGAPRESHAQVQVVSGLRSERVVAAGSRYADVIALRNPTTAPIQVTLSQTDYRFSADGTNVFGAPGHAARSNAKWTSVEGSVISIPPGATVRIPYTVSVPAVSGGAIVGTYWSVVMVEGDARECGSARAAAGKTAVGFCTRMREGIQLVTHIGLTGAMGARFEGAKVSRTGGGGRALEFDLVNTGERGYRPALTLELFDAQGASVGKYVQSSPYLYPGTSARERFDLSAVPPGEYKVLLLADGGGDSVFGAQYTIRF